MRSNPPITTTTTIGRSNRPTTPRHARRDRATPGRSGPLAPRDGVSSGPAPRPRGADHTRRQGHDGAANAICSLFARLISDQPAVLFSLNKPATSNQSAVLFSQNKQHQSSATSQPNRLLVVSSAQGRGAGPLSNLATRNRRACTFSCPGPSPTPAPACAGVFAPFLRPRPTPIRSSARARWQGSAKCRGRRGRVAPAPAGGPGE
jgi:hypothetical protein